MSIDTEMVGELVDTAENYLVYGNVDDSPMARLPVEMRIDALTNGLIELRDKLRAAYVEDALNDPWEDMPLATKGGAR